MIIKIDMSGRRFAYEDSIQQLRSCLALAGRDGYFQLDIILNGAAPSVSLLMARKTLYIDGFLGTNNRWYYFNDSPKPKCASLGIAGNVVALKMDGTHTDLGTNKDATKFVLNTKNELLKLAAFNGGNDTDLKMALSFAAVTCAEATRFKEVQDKIEALLSGNIDSYKPLADWGALFKNWQALTLANSAKVTVAQLADG